jgi:hypothetical protein
MGSYGRNVDFRVVPIEQQRRGRILQDESTDIAIGAPFVINDAVEGVDLWTDALPAKLATSAQAPKRGMCGIGIYEWIDFNQLDPEYFTYSDRDKIPAKRQFQLISGPGIKVVFRNTTNNRSFMGTRTYPGRIMVAGMGATPTVKVGDYLSPGVGNDASGYWATSTSVNGWLHVTNVDAKRQEVEAEFIF